MLFRLKIAVCAPKILIGRKKLKIPSRLKITDISKNYGLKIPVRVRVRVRARMYDEENRTHDHHRTTHHRTHQWNTRPPEKGGFRQSGKPVYIGRLPTMKKSIKKFKKNLEIRKKVVTL